MLDSHLRVSSCSQPCCRLTLIVMPGPIRSVAHLVMTTLLVTVPVGPDVISHCINGRISPTISRT